MAIYFNEKNKTFYLESKGVSYIFAVAEGGYLQHLYYGGAIAREDLQYSVYSVGRGQGCYAPYDGGLANTDEDGNECPVFGRGDYRESAVDFAFGDSNVCELHYVGYEITDVKSPLDGMPSVRGKQTLAVHLSGGSCGVRVVLYYTVFEDLPVILRHAEIVNEGDKPFTVERAYSFCIDLPNKAYDIITLPGAHLRERQPERTPLRHGTFTLMSKRGISSGQMNPFAAVVSPTADEDCGTVYGFNLVYSGNFVLKAEISQSETLRVTGGLNDYGMHIKLAPGGRFVTPEAVAVYSNDGLGGMSRAFHDLYRKYLINPRYAFKPRPVVLNSWEAAYFDFDAEKLCAIIDGAAGTGIDTFVLDDGWFGARDSDSAGLGDWEVNTRKIKGGLKTVIDRAREKGMKFGLWFEPEMVNPDSNLFRAHPDWIIRTDGLQPCRGREQYVLDLSKPEVREYIIGSVSKVLRENEIDYVKWDMNRPLSDIKFSHEYVLGFYKVCEALVNGFPQVFFEGCASGGCRFDPAMLYYFPQIWTSDNSDAYARTVIQYGTSLCYPLSAMSCHVSVVPNHQTGRITPFGSRADIAHLGATGYELDPNKLTAAELKQISSQVQAYKDMQELVLRGDLYRLNNPQHGNLFAFMLVSKDGQKAHLTAMRTLNEANGGATRIYPQGLLPDADYTVPELNITKKGNTLMQTGIVANFPFGDFTTVVFNFVKVD